VLLFAQRNPKPCPILDVSDPRAVSTPIFAGDLRTDIPAYRIYEHGAVPAELGITDLGAPDFGDPVEVRPGEVPVFWACGVTPQSAIMQSRPPFAIGHAPGHMAITGRARQRLRRPLTRFTRPGRRGPHPSR